MKLQKLLKPIAIIVLGMVLLQSSSLINAEAAVRIKDVASLSGASEFRLIGYGLIVGLDRTGDSQKSIFTNQSLTNMLERFGISVDGEKVRSKNVAAVMVTAEVAPFSKTGSKFDVTVSSLGDAKSLQGGVLLQTPMADINGAHWATASGPIALGGFNIETEMVSVRQNHPSVGRIPNGGVLQRNNPHALTDTTHLTYTLATGDFSSTLKCAEAINAFFGTDLAYAADAVSVEIDVPDSLASPTRLVQFISLVENLEFERSMPARVVINERTGTIVIGEHVSISKVAISHGSLTIRVQSTPQVSQPAPFSRTGETVQGQQQDVEIEEGDTQIFTFPSTSNVGEVGAALNRLGVAPRDIISIFQALKTAGALQAELVII
ncbi:flagellar basal body P-ring protein FlgI [Calditrichota bacterium]